MTSRTPSTPDTSAPRRTGPLLNELDREWARLRRRPSTIRTVRAWTTHGPLHDVARRAGDLDDLVRATQPTSGNRDEAANCLRDLVALARTHELAGRIVLQRLLPGLISAGRRWAPHTGSFDPSDIVVGAAWIAIRNFDTTTRRAHVAPAIIADAMWVGFRRNSRRMSAHEVLVPSTTLAGQPAPAHELDPMPALAGTLRAAARAGVPTAELDVIRLLAAARSPSQAARNCQVAPRTIRNRRDIAGRAIREALGTEWSDWSDPLVAAA